MPIHAGKDLKGAFYQWGTTGKKYYFNPENRRSKVNAKNKAEAQQTAIYSSGFKGDEIKKIFKIKCKPQCDLNACQRKEK